MKKYLIIIGSFIACLALGVLAFYLLGGNVEAKLNGSTETIVTVNTNYEDAGYELLSFGDKIDSSKYTVVEGNNIDINNIGEYRFFYDIKYRLKNFHLERIVKVVDNVSPEITTNIRSIERDFCTKKDKVKLEYSALDNYDGDITDKVIATEEESSITLTVIDANKNKKEMIIPITYAKKPENIFKLNGNSNVSIKVGGKYTESGASYTDGCGKKINEQIKISGNVDTSKVGTYKITYSLQNGKSLTRSVNVYKQSANTSSGKGKTIYLTFDDGPGVYTKKILDTLAKYNVKATFFVTNQFPKYTYLIKDEKAAGHAVAVHTYTHNYNIYKSVGTYVNDFNRMNNIIEKYTGSKSKIFRFPGGSSNTVSRKYARGVVRQIANKMTNDGYKYFDWDVSSGDAAGASRSKIYSNVVNGASRCSKCVILMHDIKYNTAYELDNILKTLTAKGYKFGTLSTSSPTVHHAIAN